MKLSKPLILGSSSPRRKELLENMGVEFSQKNLEADESYPTSLTGAEIASHIAINKANSCKKLDNGLLLTADTIVELKGRILGKPKNKAEAAEMLSLLSGEEHQVHTAFCLSWEGNIIVRSDTASVCIATISEKEIDYYIENYHPFDKAGSYGVQDWLGICKITAITGSFYTIMGLNTHQLYQELQHFRA